MANKVYEVVKDGEVLKKLKTLAAAKKLADAEGAEVFCDGQCVYHGALTVTPSVSHTVTPAVAETVEAAEPVIAEPVIAEPEDMEPEEKKSDTYRLLRKMNVRAKPSLSADKLTVLNAGVAVEASKVENDWLCLTDGGFILYENRKNAVKV